MSAKVVTAIAGRRSVGGIAGADPSHKSLLFIVLLLQTVMYIVVYNYYIQTCIKGTIMAITQEQIFSVVNNMVDAGQKPTLARVRKCLGAGSYTTISAAMAHWRAKKSAQAAQASEPIPQVIADKLADWSSNLWSTALAMANNRLTAEREALETTRREIEATRQEATDLADQLTTELDAAKARIAALKKSLADSQAGYQAQAVDLAQTRERLALTEQAATATIEQMTKAQSERDSAREEAARLRGQVEILQVQVNK